MSISFITSARYDCPKNEVIITYTGTNIINRPLALYNRITGELAPLTKITNGRYKVNGTIKNGAISIIEINGYDENYITFPKYCSCSEPDDILKKYNIKCLDFDEIFESLNNYDLSDIDIFFSLNTTISFYLPGCKAICSGLQMTLSAEFEYIQVVVRYENAYTPIQVSLVGVDRTTNCPIFFFNYKQFTPYIKSGTELNIRYDCLRGLQYNKKNINYYDVCPQLPKLGSRLNNGIYRFCIRNKEEDGKCFSSYTTDINVKCSLDKADHVNSITCGDSSQYFTGEWTQGEDYCYYYNITTFTDYTKIEFFKTTENRASCDGFFDKGLLIPLDEYSRYGLIFEPTKKFPILTPYQSDPPYKLNSGEAIVMKLTVKVGNEFCSYYFCVPRCALPIIDHKNDLRNPVIKRHILDGEDYISIENPRANGDIYITFNGEGYGHLIHMGLTRLIKMTDFGANMSYNFKSFLNEDILYKTSIKTPLITEPEAGLFYISSSGTFKTT